MGDGNLQVVWDLIQSVADGIAMIAGFIGRIVKIVKNWLGDAYTAMVAFLKGLKAAGYKLFAYLLTILKTRCQPIHVMPDKDWPIYELSDAPALPIWGALALVGAPKNSNGDFWT